VTATRAQEPVRSAFVVVVTGRDQGVFGPSRFAAACALADDVQGRVYAIRRVKGSDRKLLGAMLYLGGGL
jgi:hypothetical protein